MLITIIIIIIINSYVMLHWPTDVWLRQTHFCAKKENLWFFELESALRVEGQSPQRPIGCCRPIIADRPMH